MAESAEQDMIGVLRRLAKASGSLDTNMVRELHQSCEVCKEILNMGARDLVESAGGWPVLCSRSCDGTPMQTAARRVHGSAGMKFHSVGKASHELLVKNEFLRSFIHGEGWQTRVILKEATSLVHGKSAAAILGVCWPEWTTLRARGHAGPAVEHYVFDRCGYTALERVTRQHHMESCRTYRHLAPEKPADYLPLTEFLVYTPCAIHDAHNAFRWGHMKAISDRDFMRTVYIGMESLRNGIDALDTNLGSWVARKLRFAAPKGLHWQESQQSMWVLLDVDPRLATSLMELQLRFVNGNLLVSREWAHRTDVVSTIIDTLGPLWRFQKWTESRWLTVGSSTRIFLAGIMTGVGDFGQGDLRFRCEHMVCKRLHEYQSRASSIPCDGWCDMPSFRSAPARANA